MTKFIRRTSWIIIIGMVISVNPTQARFYVPEEGRFLQEDSADEQDGSSKYVYVGNNPVNFIDPNGLTAIPTNPSNGSNTALLNTFPTVTMPGVGTSSGNPPGVCAVPPTTIARATPQEFETCYLFDKGATVCRYMCVDGRIEDTRNPGTPFKEACPNTQLFPKRK